MSGPTRRRALGVGAAGLAFAIAPHAARAGARDSLVTIGGAVTECVFALGHGARIVGTDTTSSFPAATQHLKRVGYLRQIAPEGVASLGAKRIIASDEVGPPAALLALQGLGVELRLIPDRAGRDGTLAKIDAVAAALGEDDAGRNLAALVAEDFAAVSRMIAIAAPRVRVLFLLSTSRGAMLAAGRETAADAALALAGARNVIDGYVGYKPLSPEVAAASAPDAIVTMSQTIESGGGVDAILALPQVAPTPAARARRLVGIEGSFLLQFGPRAPHAIHALATALTPALGLPPLPARPWVTS